ncbi:MAG: DNA primase [Pirellulales bacterium]|nr:DNA primase [Pirellulales bacterium]
MQAYAYGFRIAGSCREARRLVDADAALSAYAACDERAEVTCESYLSAFQFGAEFRSHLELTGSTRGYNGPCWARWLWWDIDREHDIEAATRDARALAAALVDRYRLDGDDLLIFYSGSKGFHVGLPTALWRPDPAGKFNKAARRFADRMAERLGIAIDAGVYDKVRAFRAPNSRHPKTGRYKRRFSFDELLGLRTAALVEWAAEPEPFDLPKPPATNDQAAADWLDAVRDVAQATAAQRGRRAAAGGSARLNRQTMEFIRDGATKGDRHRLLFSAAANLAELGCPPALAAELLTESALDSGLSPGDVRRQIQCGLERGGAS